MDKKSIFEMIMPWRKYGSEDNLFHRVRTTFNYNHGRSTIDSSTPSYLTCRAVYKGSEIIKDGKVYGEKMLLAAAFAKPIVHAITSIVLANPPSVTTDNGDEEMEEALLQWYFKFQNIIFDALRDSQSEGDSYLLIQDSFLAKPIPLLPENVEPIVNPRDYTDVVGYNVDEVINQVDEKKIKKTKLRTIYRKTAPYKIVFQYKREKESSDKIIEIDGVATDININNDILYYQTISTIDDFRELFADNEELNNRFPEGNIPEIRPLPIVAFHHAKDRQAIKGDTVYRNLFNYFYNYHRILEHAIKNLMFNMVSIPYITGVETFSKFMQENGIKGTDGEYRLSLDPNKVLIGENLEIKFPQMPGTMEEFEKMSNILFWLIVQASEIPEFFFGAAVKSTFASVKEQFPIILNKAKRFQNEYHNYLQQLLETAAFYKARNADVRIDTTQNFSFTWGEVRIDDIEGMKTLVDTLKSYGLITDSTAAHILSLAKYVPNVEKEIALAREEQEEVSRRGDSLLFGNSNAEVDDEEEPEEQ